MSIFYIAPSTIHGIGCFTNKKFKKDNVITFNALVIPKKFAYEYSFPWDIEHSCIVLSELIYCNSSDKPNLQIVSIDKTNKSKTFKFLKDVNINEEITLKYL